MDDAPLVDRPPGADPPAAEAGPEEKLEEKGDRARPRCRNCGARLTGPFCAECGQEARRRAVPLRQLGADLLGEVFSFDTRFLRTVSPLLAKPGFLTREYFAGRRKRYAPPLRLYVFISFIYFLLFALPGGDGSDIEQMEAAMQEMSTQVADSVATSSPARSAAGDEAARVERAAGLAGAFTEGISIALDRLSLIFFCLIPLMALALTLLYWRGRWLYVHHLVFVLHVQAFFFVAGLPALAAEVRLPASTSDVPAQVLEGLSTGAFLIYGLLAMKRFYGQGWGKTALKAAALVGFYGAAFAAGTLLLVAYAFFRTA